jgi:aspartokinase-like uncharacterized kinase
VSGMAATEHGLAVVKLGGSYAFSPRLPAILQALAGSKAPLVLVAGGGPFADAVREAQPRMRFGDRAAHRMALLAMAQFAEALAGLVPSLRAASDIAAIRGALEGGNTPVWSPWPIADGLDALPESWALTSDSLAAWLAARLQAARLILLKHGDPPPGGMNLDEMAETGVVDPLFPEFAARFRQAESPYAPRIARSICWVGPSQLGTLAGILDERPEARPPLNPALPCVTGHAC